MDAKKGLLQRTPNWVWVLGLGAGALVCAPITLGVWSALEGEQAGETPVAQEIAGETPTAQESYWDRALAAGMAAAEGAQTAATHEEWGEVAKDWTEAIAFLKLIEPGEPQYDEAQAKLTDYEANRTVANQRQAAVPAAPTELSKATEALAAYEAVLRSVDPSGALFGAVSFDEHDDDLESIVVVVKDGWHYQPKTAREEAARNLWKGWVQLRLPEDADHAKLRLETPSGKHVGGSRVLAGSLIWVED